MRAMHDICVFSYFPFIFEGRMWDLIVSVPDHCLSFYFGCGRTGERFHQFLLTCLSKDQRG